MASIYREQLAAALEEWRDQVIEADCRVDRARADLARAVAALHEAVQERARVVRHLRHLLQWAREMAA